MGKKHTKKQKGDTQDDGVPSQLLQLDVFELVPDAPGSLAVWERWIPAHLSLTSYEVEKMRFPKNYFVYFKI